MMKPNLNDVPKAMRRKIAKEVQKWAKEQGMGRLSLKQVEECWIFYRQELAAGRAISDDTPTMGRA